MISQPPRKLTEKDDRNQLSCGKPDLDEWFRKFALSAQQSDQSTTYVLLDDADQIVGYYSIAMGAIAPESATERARQGMGKYQIPAIILTRLAVDRSYQGQGIGKSLLRDCVIRSLSISDEIGTRLLLTHPIDPEASDFYLKNGFSPSAVDSSQLMILMKDLRKTATQL